ncbi:MarR family winged helix-turn-helix transcriptional regulator [Pseudorhodoplanes sp.]|uniref:MarR family winged helix-turn-helix transcriptional regulator n=1 Tax=Pseudorhodoplanes sp. TaxID=1934341 RepID=UPI00391D8813
MTRIKARKFDVGQDFGPKDLETPGRKKPHQDLCLWLRLLTLHKLIDNEMRRRLRESYNMSLARFHLLAQLSVAPDGLRMGELSSRMMVTTGNVTGLTDELEADGLVERVVDPSNRRANLAYMTKKGRALFDEAAQMLEIWIEDFFSIYSSKDKQLLFDLLGKQKAFVLKRLTNAQAETPE